MEMLKKMIIFNVQHNKRIIHNKPEDFFGKPMGLLDLVV